MIASNVLRTAAPEAIAAQTTTLAPAANANHVHLVLDPFPNDPAAVIGDYTLATFTGSAAKSAGLNAQQSYQDPTSGKRFIQILEPAGGWNWECSVAPASPETVAGVVLTDNADAVVLAYEAISPAVVISAVGHAVQLGQLRLQLPESVFE